ncbi:MAG: ELM1/GtrOC1 family putative glycosyltransferase, partial [Proteobacteria bacterium]|nr:ELM1/GtrOC1 family putative glycosyltransferase [Pseudomonadota bacterium]
LGRVDGGLLEKEYQKFSDDLEGFNSPKIALLVGGSSKEGQFDVQIAKQLAKTASQITNNMKGNLLVTTSRRTGLEVTKQLKNNLDCSNFFFEWQEGKTNPYFAFLHIADYIITTGDSMSMCSESCSTGKPVYIFNPAQICSKKHLRFHESLFSNSYAKRLDSKITILENSFAKKLDETSRIASKTDVILDLKGL